MKNAFAFTLALSALATSAAFASPQHSAAATGAQVTAQQPVDVAQASTDKGADGFKKATDEGLILADNRKEFGSQYQRY